MREKWYYFAIGVIFSAAVFSLLSATAPEGQLFAHIPSTGLIVKEAVKADLDAAQKMDIALVDYSMPFNGRDDLPQAVVYNGREYKPRVASYEDFKAHAGSLEVSYLVSIGVSPEGKFPVYFVSVGSGPFLEGVVVLDTAFPEGSEPLT